uniref:Uncharacterized protein n=1 Tax=Cannabis sativa TaxID=3483 RepID=A0A803PV19_CANSA
MHPLEFGIARDEDPSEGLYGALEAEEACPRGGSTPDIDDNIPLSKIARNLKRRERAFYQFSACGGMVGDDTLLIRPRGQGSDRPTCPFPTSRGKGKAAGNISNDSSFEDDGHPRAKVDRTTQSNDVVGSSLPPPPPRPAPADQSMIETELLAKGEALTNAEALAKQRHGMITGLEHMLGIRNQENHTLVAKASRLEVELGKMDEALKLALDGQQPIRDEMQTDRTIVQPNESSLSHFDEAMASTPTKEVASQAIDQVAGQPAETIPSPLFGDLDAAIFSLTPLSPPQD